MRIFFTTPRSSKAHIQPHLDEILKLLKKSEAVIISPENTDEYEHTMQQYAKQHIPLSRAHYAYIAQGIAEADIVIVEASHSNLQLGHEVTLALLYHKPTLVLSQKKNYADHISHSMLTGARYETKQELRAAVEKFIQSAKHHLSPNLKIGQDFETAADSLRLTAFATMRQRALQDDGELGNLAALADRDQEKAAKRVQRLFGDIPIEKPWSVFASIYNEDTPDFIFAGVIQFAQEIFAKHAISKKDHIVDATTRGGTVARQLLQVGYTDLSCFNSSREMLAKTYEFCARNSEIKILEATPQDITLSHPAKGIIWIDYSANLTLDEDTLRHQLNNLLSNLATDGCLIFDIRTIAGWGAYFLREKVVTFSSVSFQRVSLNTQDKEKGLMHFDRFIRLKQPSGNWGEWRREKMIDRMWSLAEIKAIIATLEECTLEGIYDDNFALLTDDHEPNLAYFVLKKL